MSEEPLSQSGHIVSLQLCVGHRQPMKSVGSVQVLTGVGINGDRHAVADGIRVKRQVLLMDQETLTSFRLTQGDLRENITIRDFDLYKTQEGQRIALGEEVVLSITGHCAPCARMDEIRQGLRTELDRRRGMLSYVEQGGMLHVGDPVTLL